MGIVRRNSSFLLAIALILGVGASIFAGVVAVRVVAAEGSAQVTATTDITATTSSAAMASAASPPRPAAHSLL
jgi:hypothetical protein